ncbi:MAG: GCN5-related N-acetyltransferase [Clostridiales bacterium]|jgi:GNAT superfamily N-acetyltransferase|nr:GCN5-related N-acetyltransferase [Clostridiales bacterium]
MDIEICKLIPELAEDYVHFFDTTPHDKNVVEHKCYCVCWCNDDYEGKDFSTAEKRRKYALQYVKGNNIQGYLAYSGNTAVGWCNANTKSDCLKCVSWRRFMDYVPLEESNTGIKVKSVFCFVIAPEMKRKSIATLLLERVCKDALQDGFDFVEVYPYKESSYQSSDFGGYFEMYKKSGFHVSFETEQGLVMRKQLK